MKTCLRLLPLIVTFWLFPACSSVPRDATHAAWLQQALDTVLPPTFTGYIKASHHNDYFTLDFEGDGLKRTDRGWTWEWLAYNRRSHIPVFSGVNLSSTGQVLLGRPPPAQPLPARLDAVPTPPAPADLSATGTLPVSP